MKDFWQTTPVSRLKGVGDATAKKLQRIGLEHLQDLLFHLPSRYQDRTRLTHIATARPSQEVLLQGCIESCQVFQGKTRSLICHISDGSSRLQLRFFHFSAAQQQQLKPGALIRCFGEVRHKGLAGQEMVHPEYQILDNLDEPVSATLTPVYPATEGISQHLLRKLNQQALQLLGGAHPIKELIAADVVKHHAWPSLTEALIITHRPPPDANLQQLLNGSHPAQRRLALEELLAHHLSLMNARQQYKHQRAIALQPDGDRYPKLINALPFKLTMAQQRVSGEIRADLMKTEPMLRLVQGDVGSGKTLVAVIAALHCIDAGFQAALMAPTEILAEQHLQFCQRWLQPLGIKIAWLSGKLKASKRQQALADIATQAELVIGTHALFQDQVEFKNLGLVIIDEQHRFGVHQRLRLQAKAKHYPHQLVMTATPIPRTLAMSAYADLDSSIIDELPPGRKPITTVAIDTQRRDQVIERIAQACRANKQAYWVCTLIEESEALQCQAAEDCAQQLAELLPQVNIGLVHGRMKAQEKTAALGDFQRGTTQVLVATTVIEVGVDVANASIMIIENPERLGLAQLHQLRGRVGRGSEASYCVLLYQTPLGQQSKARLDILRGTQDGFAIAQKDLELRGPGEVLGTRQTGEIGFRVADLMRDEDLLEWLPPIAAQMQQQPEDCAFLIKRWLGANQAYARV